MNFRAEFYCNTAEEIELVLEFTKKIEALRTSKYPPQGLALSGVGSNSAIATMNKAVAAQQASQL